MRQHITRICCLTGWTVFAGSRIAHPEEPIYAHFEAQHWLWFMDWSPLATLLGVLNNRHLGDIKNERPLSLKVKTLPYRFSIILIPGQKQKARKQTRENTLVMRTKFPWIAISRSRFPLLVLNCVSAFLRPP